MIHKFHSVPYNINQSEVKCTDTPKSKVHPIMVIEGSEGE